MAELRDTLLMLDDIEEATAISEETHQQFFHISSIMEVFCCLRFMQLLPRPELAAPPMRKMNVANSIVFVVL
jgi:hypothetical protein